MDMHLRRGEEFPKLCVAAEAYGKEAIETWEENLRRVVDAVLIASAP
jgi:hypothetical protein